MEEGGKLKLSLFDRAMGELIDSGYELLLVNRYAPTTARDRAFAIDKLTAVAENDLLMTTIVTFSGCDLSMLE